MLLPGQSMHYPQTLRALSTTISSLSQSYYTFVISKNGELALVWEHNVTYWRSHLRSKEARFNSSGVLGLYDDRDNIIWFVSSKDFDDLSLSFRHLRIDRDWNLRIYSWDNGSRVWKAVWQAVEDQCSVFGSCGPFSVCGYNSSGPVCDCLAFYPLESQMGGSALDLGGVRCLELDDLKSCMENTVIMALKHSVLYGMYPSHDLELPLSEAACKEYCTNDSSCIAATSMNDGSGRCTIKQTNFLSGYKTSSIHVVSFLKICPFLLGLPVHPNAMVAFRPEKGSNKWMIREIAVVGSIDSVDVSEFSCSSFLASLP